MDLSLEQMMRMQEALFQIHKEEWPPLEPEHGKNMILYMVEEIGEVIAIVKKKGDQAVVDDPAVRSAFLEEMADVLMYYTDTLLRYHVSAEELSDAYVRKHKRNIARNFSAEYKEKYHG